VLPIQYTNGNSNSSKTAAAAAHDSSVMINNHAISIIRYSFVQQSLS